MQLSTPDYQYDYGRWTGRPGGVSSSATPPVSSYSAKHQSRSTSSTVATAHVRPVQEAVLEVLQLENWAQRCVCV